MKNFLKAMTALMLSAALVLPALCGCGRTGRGETSDIVSSENDFELSESTGSAAISFVSSLSDEVVASEENSANVKPLSVITGDGYTLITWSAAWKNASSTWALGKAVSDYLTITPDAEDARSASAECLQAFGEPIIITAMRQDNGESASRQCDYVKRYPTVNKTAYAVGFYTLKEDENVFAGASTDQTYGFVLDGETPCSISAILPSYIYTVNSKLRIAKIRLHIIALRSLIVRIKDSAYLQAAKELDSSIDLKEFNDIGNNFYGVIGEELFYSEKEPCVNVTYKVKFSVGNFFTCGAEGYESLKQSNPECVKYLQYAVYEGLSEGTSISCTIWLEREVEGTGEITPWGSATFTVTTLGFDFSNIATPPAES